MYLDHYGLQKKPFDITSNPDFLWLGPKHQEALSTLENGIMESRGLVLLTGEVGTGKTTLINAFSKINNVATIIVTIPDPDLDTIDFYNFLGDEFELDRKFTSREDFIYHFKGFLLRAYATYTKVLIIIDEAQRLNSVLLEEIRHLSAIKIAGRRLLKIFFVGQTEFNDILMDEENAAVREEIVAGYHIEPITLDETHRYLSHRIQVAGAENSIFDDQAIKRIHTLSQGFPRLINIICDHALLNGYVKGIHQIDLNVITSLENCYELPIGILKPPEQASHAIPDWNVEPEEFTIIENKSKAIWVWIIVLALVLFGTSGYLLSQANPDASMSRSVISKVDWFKEQAITIYHHLARKSEPNR
jgi:general secretion pathway protein A